MKNKNIEYIITHKKTSFFYLQKGCEKNMELTLLELKQLEEQYMKGKLSKTKKKQLDKYWKQYLKENPADFETRGLLSYNQWFWLDTPPSQKERKLLKLLGEAEYNEEKNNLEKAVQLYDQANIVYFQLYGDELHQIELETGRKLAPQLTVKSDVRIIIPKAIIIIDKNNKVTRNSIDEKPLLSFIMKFLHRF